MSQGLSQDREEDESVMFSCRLDNAKAVTTILSCLSHGTRKDQHAQCEVNPDGLTFVVTGKAKFTQAQGSLGRELFQDFDCDGDGGKFGINLTTLLECLQIFGTSSLAQTSVSMAYQEGRTLFRLTLEEGGVFTSCEIRTVYQDEEAMEFSALAKAFTSREVTCKCILKSEYLKEAFQELADVNGATCVTVVFGNTAPNLMLSASGSIGSRDRLERVELLMCYNCIQLGIDRLQDARIPQVSWTYLMAGMEVGMRALPHADETYFRVNEEGILCIQHQIPMNLGQTSYVDVLICPDAPEEEDDDGMEDTRIPEGDQEED